ncbi:MAG: hypothetical protein R3F43_20710, partial [bacterium]
AGQRRLAAEVAAAVAQAGDRQRAAAVVAAYERAWADGLATGLDLFTLIRGDGRGQAAEILAHAILRADGHAP